MNNFATIENSKGFLKNDYSPKQAKKKDVDVLEIIQKRREGSIKDQFSG